MTSYHPNEAQNKTKKKPGEFVIEKNLMTHSELLRSIRARQNSESPLDQYSLTYCTAFLVVIGMIIFFAYLVPNCLAGSGRHTRTARKTSRKKVSFYLKRKLSRKEPTLTSMTTLETPESLQDQIKHSVV